MAFRGEGLHVCHHMIIAFDSKGRVDCSHTIIREVKLSVSYSLANCLAERQSKTLSTSFC